MTRTWRPVTAADSVIIVTALLPLPVAAGFGVSQSVPVSDTYTA